MLNQTRHEADRSNRGTLVIIKQTRHEADHSKGEVLVIINSRGMKLTTLNGSFVKGKADNT